MTTHPRILTLLLAVALGLLTTLAVAAACGLFLEVPYGLNYLPPKSRPSGVVRAFILDGQPWVVNEFSRPGLTTAWWTPITRDYFTAPSPSAPTQPGSSAPSAPPSQEDPAILIRDLIAHSDTVRDPRSPFAPRTDRPAHWGEFAKGHAPPPRIPPTLLPPSDPDALQPTHFIGADFGYGWPCIALWYQVLGRRQGLTSDEDSFAGAWVATGAPAIRGQPRCRVVPFWPIWKGLLIDTLFYAALWWLLLTVPASLRRTIRRRRNRCEHCNYDLHATPPTTPCPECGQTAKLP